VLSVGWSDPARRRTFTRNDLLGMAAMVVSALICVVAVHGTGIRVVVGALMLAAELGLIVGRRVLPLRWAFLGVGVTIGTGLAVTILAPDGVGEVPVLAGASILPFCVPSGRLRQAAVAAVSVAFGLTIMIVSDSPAGLLAGVGAWFLAERSIEHEALQSERDRAVALLAEVEASRQAQQEATAAEERNRIAREMHDVLAHSLAGLSMQLQAIRAIAGRENVPASVTGPLDRAATLAREGVQEARAAVGALRAPQLRGVDDLQHLVDTFPGDAALSVTGHPGHLSPEAGHAVYRAVQEAITNAARYATGSRIGVEVAWGEGELRVRVRDHGVPPGRQASGVKGSGTGLSSMAERIEAAGGSLSAGPLAGSGGWQVEVQVPAAADPPPAPAPAPTPQPKDEEATR